MAAPTLNSATSSTYTDVTTNAETVSISWSAGDVIVVVGATEDDGRTLSTPTATGLTFSLIAEAGNASDTNVYAWSATAAGAGSGVTVSATTSGGDGARGITAFVYSGSDGIGASAEINGSTAKTIGLTRGGENSAVIVVLADWNQVGDVTVDPTPAGGTQRVAVAASGRYDAFVFDWLDQGGAGTTSYGITNHTGTVDMSGIVVEVLGTGGGIGGGMKRPWRMGMLGVN